MAKETAEKYFTSERKRRLLSGLLLILLGVVVGVILALVLVGRTGRAEEPDKEVLEITQIDPDTQRAKQQQVTLETLNKKLENLSDLSTAEMIYTGIYGVSEGKIPFITKKGFSMVYRATIRAGIDASQVRLELTDDQVRVVLPPAEIQLLKVDPASIQFYDEKHALFNGDERADVTEAIAIAEQELAEKEEMDDLLKRADQQAEYVIHGLLEGVAEERELVITRAG